MPNNASRSAIKINDAPTLTKAHQILNKEIKIFDQDKKLYQYKYELVSDVNLLNYKKKKLKVLRKFSAQLLKTSSVNFKPSLRKKNLKNFSRYYRILSYSFFLRLKLHLYKGLNVIRFPKFESISKLYYSQAFYPKFLKLILKLGKIYTHIISQSFAISKYTSEFFYKKVTKFIRLLKIFTDRKYTEAPSYKLLKICYTLDLFLIKKSNYLKQIFQENKKFLFESNKISQLKNIIFSQFIIFRNLFVYLENIKNFICSIEKKQIKEVLKRVLDVFCLYFIPFIFLSTQAFVPLMEEYEYIIVNPFANFFIGNIPFLPDIIKYLRPIIKNPLLLFWAPLAYLLIFPLNYKSLKIPYKFAFNGTVALVFLIINYSCVLMQFLLRIVFESSKIVKDIFFTSFLMKRIGKSKLKKDKDQVIKLFSNLVARYDINMQKSYYEFLLLINHRFFSYLALISLAALLYNCTYYVIHNKNPEIIIITKAVLGTIKNPQDGKE